MSNLIIANGRSHHDADIGNFAYCTQSGLSVVDYLLLHPSDIHTISEFTVLEFNKFSDHAPLFFTFQPKHMYTNVIHSDNQDQQSIPHAPRRANQIRFDNEKIPIFRTQLLNNHEQLHRLTEIVNTDPVDDILKSFTTYMYENSEQVFGTNNSHTPTHRKPNTQHSEWFNNECRTTKKEFKAARNIFLQTKMMMIDYRS